MRFSIRCVMCNNRLWEDQAHCPWPIHEEGKCCFDCNKQVILARAKLMVEYYENERAGEEEA